MLIRIKNFLFNFFIYNKILSIIIIIYCLLMISVIQWGIPNQNHPFNYHMDEWHQLESIKSLYKHGTSNVSGAANGTVFHFLLSGIYLSPFILLKVIDPFLIKSNVGSLLIQQKLFEILRINTLMFGILSLLTIYILVKKYFKINPAYSLLLFVITPLWLALSNYFKYDIALTFWITISLFYLLNYGLKPTPKNYIIAGIFCSLSLATKVSALPLFIIYIFSFFYFNFGRKKKYKHLLIGLVVFICIFLVFGIPDLILQKGDYREYLYSNLIGDQINFKNFIFQYNPWWAQILLKAIPLDFGYVFYGIFLSSIIYWSVKLTPKIIKFNFKNFKNEIFLFVSVFIFILSLIPLEFGANGNRLLVLLPFFAIFSGLLIQRLIRHFARFKFQIYSILIILITIQFFQSFIMVYVKWQADPRQISSDWIVKNVNKRATIGIENIPIYQELPDLVVKEFYSGKESRLFEYKIIDSESSILPATVIITNKEFDVNFLKKSSKKNLVIRLNNEKYKVIKEFKLPWFLYFIMGNELGFYSSGIVPIPSISIYAR